MQTDQRGWEPMDPSVAFFPVELRPLHLAPVRQGADWTKLPRHFAVVDVQRNNPLAVVTEGYELVTNRQAIEMADIVMKEVFQTTNLGDMQCMNVTMPKTRSFCHIDLVHKSSSFSPWEGDAWNAFLRVTNSYNRTRPLRFEVGFCRWICTNGMIFGQRSVEFSYAHIRGAAEDMGKLMHNRIGDIRKLEAALTEKLHQLKRYYVPEEEMLPLVCRTFGIRVDKQALDKPRRIDELRAVRTKVHDLSRHYFDQLGPNGYAALNVLTEFASRPVGVIAPKSSMHGMQKKAGNWVGEFIAAIKSDSFSFVNYLADYRETARALDLI